MNYVRNIVDEFGGMTPMSKALGHRHPTTVQGWLNSGRIPRWRRHEVKVAADREGVDIAKFMNESEVAAFK